MNLTGPLARAIALAGLLLATPMAVAPAFAAKADVELLQSYIGNWKGRGTLVGADQESVVCRLNLTPGNGDKVNYSGRCSLAGTSLSVNGTLAFNDAAKQFEAAMTSNVTFTGVAVGKKLGNAVVFNLREQDKDEEGRDLTISAAITLKADNISVNFQVLFNESGETLKAEIPFTK